MHSMAMELWAMRHSSVRDSGRPARNQTKRTQFRSARSADRCHAGTCQGAQKRSLVVGVTLPRLLKVIRPYLLGQFRQGPVILTAIRASSLLGFTSLLAVAHPNSYMRRSCLFPATALSVMVMLALAPGARSP